MKVLSLTLMLVFTSCASYVNKIHRQIDQDSYNKRQGQNANGYQKAYRRGQDRRPIQNPVTLNGVPTAGTQRNYNPRVKRKYDKNRRYKADDLLDNGSDGSLWAGQSDDNFLFVTNNLKRKGDIVIIDVYEQLKDKIQDELKRNFPPAPKKKTKKKTADGAEEEKEEKNVAAASATPADPEKVHDKISAQVVEIVNNDYIMLRGRKEVLFRDRKRYFEIQAIVSQKDITSNDTVESKKMLEPRINVLRY